MRVMGVDGAPGGWLGAVWDGSALRVLYHTRIEELYRQAQSPRAVAIDIPIGLAARGNRQADIAAREFLGPRRSTVFLSPVRAVLDHGARNYDEANRISRNECGAGLSRQAFALLPKIEEVENWRHSTPATVREAHPEVSFQVLAARPLRARKKTWNGAIERWRLLAAAQLQPSLECDAGAAGVDDVLDAAVLAWTARRIATGNARGFPTQPTPDHPVIWA